MCITEENILKLKQIFICVLALLLALSVFTACKEKEGAEDTEETAAKFYTVTFVSTGGTEVEPKLVKEGTTVTEPDAPEKEGWIFMGWYNGKFKWSFSEKVYEDMTLTAKWSNPENLYEHTPAEDGNSTVITGLKQKEGELRLPSEMGGYKVTAIGDGVFSGLSSENVYSIILPESITVIGNEAFSGCADISITVEGKLTQVGEKAFLGCTGLTEISFAEGIESISAEAFVSSGIRTVSLPKSLKVVDENAFDDCQSLEAVFMYDSIEAVNDSAFYGAPVKAIYFYGSEENIDALLEDRVLSRNDSILGARKYIYSETKPAETTDLDGYWYFDTNGKIRLWK